ncbi:MAG: S41 family peptidase [Candidatus Margulisiibacteriota bacterium]
MKRKIFLLACLTTLFLSVPALAQNNEEVNFNVLLETFGAIKGQYVEHVTENRKLVYGAIRGMLETLGDPYSRFMEPTDNSEMKTRLDGEFFGIGIQIGIKDNFLIVISPIEDTPAFKAGLKAKDQIVRIDGKNTKGISLSEAVSKIRGPKGSPVVLGINRPTLTPAKEFNITVNRDVIKLKSMTGTEVVTKNIGYTRLTTFESKQMMEEMTVALKKLEKENIKGLIMDVRDNGGGLLQNAILASSVFLDNGQDIVHTKARDGIVDTKSAVNVQLKFKKPLIVLVNGNSASASEIFAGAIMDNGRGITMGSKTFGKASVQNVKELRDGFAVLITIAKYTTPKFTDITKIGIKPDIEVKVPTKNLEMISSANYVYDKKDDYTLQQAIKTMQDLIK